MGARLLTLTGAGGCGKTRLAIQVASDLAAADRYKNGVWWVELASLSDPTLVPQTIARVFDLRESADTPLITVLTNYFRAKELLLVLDNCEHLIDACAQLVEVLLSACPKLQILATSREALGLTGEVTWYVPSLESPDPHNMPPLASLTQYDAIRLFTERAQAMAAHWQLADHAEATARICCRLDGIPLAIELAAARLKVLAAEQIAERLDDRFQLLTGGSRTALPRHRTLRATIDWSYELLAEEERILFQRLAIFAGGCTLAAVESVCCGNGMAQGNLLDVLTRLVDKSMVVVDNVQDGRRYRMLETIRQYAHEKIIESGELQAMRDRHFDYFLQLAEQAGPQLLNGDPGWLNRLETEHDNLRAALEHALAKDAELALRLAMSLEWFWVWHGNVEEGDAYAMRLLPLTVAWGPGKLRARALGLAGSLAADVPGDKSACALLEASLEMARMADDRYQMAWSLYNLAALALRAGDWAQMRLYSEESLVLFREMGIAWATGNTFWQLGHAAYGSGEYESARSLFEQSLEWARKHNIPAMMAFALMPLGELARLRGDYANAGALYAECAQLRRQMGMKGGLANSLINLGQVVLHEGDHIRARALFEEVLAIFRQLEWGDWLVDALAGFAGVAGVAGKHKQAARLFGAVEAACETSGTKIDHAQIDRPDQMEYDRIIARVRAQLDEATFNAAWAEGRAMTLEQAIEYALKA
jgi:non-specific serine/threonine protein kinase